MKYVSLVLLLSVVGALVWLVEQTLSHVDRDPTQLLDTARVRMSRPDPEIELALADLDLALTGAVDAGDEALAAAILIERSDIYRRLDSYPRAADDLVKVLASYRPNDPHLILKLLAIDLAAEEYERGLVRAGELLDRDPNLTQAWTYRGRFLVQVANRKIADAEEHLAEGLPDDLHERASQIVRRLTGMDLDDPLRVALLLELRGLFREQNESIARAVHRLVDQASGDLAAARDALAESFRGSIDRDAAIEYLRILDQAGYVQESLDFGRIMSASRDVQNSPEAMELLVGLMTDAGRPVEACTLMDRRNNRRIQPSASFLGTWCRALYAAERWDRLVSIASQLASVARQRDPKLTSLAEFYVGTSYAERGNWRQAAVAFQGAMGGVDHDPLVTRNRAYMWRAMANAARERGKDTQELEALLEATRLAPNESAEAWERLAEVTLQVDPDGLLAAENAYAHALRLGTENAAEVWERFDAIGRQRLDQSGTSVILMADSLDRRNLCAPASETGPYELLQLINLWKSRGDASCVLVTATRLLRSHPNFLPALDAALKASMQLGNWSDVVHRVLERMRVGDRSGIVIEALEAIPTDYLSPKDRQRLMRFDPSGYGRLTIADDLRASGQERRALGGLVSMDPERLGNGGRMLAGELMLAVELYAQAVEVLEPIEPDSPEYPLTVPMRVRAAALALDREAFATSLAELTELETVAAAPLVQAVDDLWLAGELETAYALLKALDEHHDGRSPAGMLRLGLAALLAGEPNAAREHFDRAEAYDDSGAPTLGRLLLAIDEADWTRLPAHVAELLASGFQPSPTGMAALTLLDERLDEGVAAIEQGLEVDPDDPSWHLLLAVARAMRIEVIEASPHLGPDAADVLTRFLYGAPAGSRNPREVLGLLLALETPGWRAWSVVRWRRLRALEGVAPWPDLLVARGSWMLGRTLEARRQLRAITAEHPRFGPAWDLLEEVEIERLGRFDHADLVRLRQERRRALGPRDGEEAEVALELSWTLEKQGRLGRAFEEARNAVELDPTYLPAVSRLAQLHERAGSWREALDLYRSATLDAPAEMSSVLVLDYLDFLERAHAADSDTVSRATVAAELEVLSRNHPDDPMIALARAREKLGEKSTVTALRVRRAFDELDSFRAKTDHRPLDELRPGATRAWMEFYMELDPDAAHEFVRFEFDRVPSDIDNWLMYGETLVAIGHPEAAIDHYRLVLEMMPEAQTRRALVRLLARYGRDLSEIERHADAVALIEGRTLDPEMTFYRARALISEGGRSRDTGIELLEDLYQSPETLGDLPLAEVGRLLGTALVQRGTPVDLRRAEQVLSESVQEIPDPIRRNMTQALLYLAAGDVSP